MLTLPSGYTVRKDGKGNFLYFDEEGEVIHTSKTDEIADREKVWQIYRPLKTAEAEEAKPVVKTKGRKPKTK
jgi:hypothetical protein